MFIGTRDRRGFGQIPIEFDVPRGIIVLDSTDNDRVNSAIVASPGLEVVGTSRRGDGSIAWVTIATPAGPVNVCSIYAPARKETRIAFWRWLE